MMSSKIMSKLSPAHLACASRNFGVMSPMLCKTSDPVQKLFLNKVKEYETAAKSGKGPSNANTQKKIQSELERISKQFGGGSGVDLSVFPSLKFEEPKVDPIGN